MTDTHFEAHFQKTRRGYAHLWGIAKLTNVAGATRAAALISDPPARAALAHIELVTAVPWWFTGATLFREAPLTKAGKLNFGCYLGNGQSLAHVTTIVPKGRGPFTGPNDFYDGAIDTYTQQGLLGMPPGYWTLERALHDEEELNGEGYFGHNVNSPYLWNYTSLYNTPPYNGGYYTSDHGFDARAVDQHCGVAAIWKVLESQGLVTFAREVIPGFAPSVPSVPSVPKPKGPIIVATTPTPAPATLPIDQIEAMVESGEKLFAYAGPILSTVLPANLRPAVPLMVAALPLIELNLKMESAREHATDPASLAHAQGAILRAAADKIDPPAAGTVVDAAKGSP